MPGKGCSQPIRAELPFARGAAPLVCDRVPLVMAGSVVRGAGELAVVHERAPDGREHGTRLQQHLLVLGVRVRRRDDRAARADLQALS
jgi:hypothetical protein